MMVGWVAGVRFSVPALLILAFFVLAFSCAARRYFILHLLSMLRLV